MTPRDAATHLLAIAGFGLALWLAWPAPAPEAARMAAASPASAPAVVPAQNGWLAVLPERAAQPLPARAAIALVNGRNGRAVDLGGKSVAAYIAERMSGARRGDARAAYQVYQAASICAANDDPVAAYQDDAERARFLRERASRIALCAGVSPAQIQERLGFLATAARAGNLQAQLDFYTEGPYGRAVDLDAGAGDLIVIGWKQEALHYLEQAGDQCDHFALATLSTVYDAGALTPRDARTAMAYAIAAAAPRRQLLTEEQLRSRFGDEVQGADFDSARQLGEQLARRACGNSAAQRQ